MCDGDIMNKVNLLEEAIGKPVEEWTLDDLQNAKGDYTDVYTDETIEDIVARASEDISEIFRCVRVSRVYRLACDKLENVIVANAENSDPNDVVDFVKTSMIPSENVWERFVGCWAACDFLADFDIEFDFEAVKADINVIINTVNSIATEPGFEIIMDVVDVSNTIAQHIYDKQGINILVDCPLMDEVLEKLNLATADMYEVLARRMVEENLQKDEESNDD